MVVVVGGGDPNNRCAEPPQQHMHRNFTVEGEVEFSKESKVIC